MSQDWKNTWIMLVFLLSSLSYSFTIGLTQQSISLTKIGGNLNPIQIENQLPGTSGWQLSNPAPYDSNTFHYPAIEGYAWTTSTQVGDEVKFSVSTASPSFTATVYRLGWYHGLGGRFMLSLPHIPGFRYTVPLPDLQTGLIEANWPVAFTITISSTWLSGMYIVKLTASRGEQSYIPFVLRSSRFSDFAFFHAINTDEAYNFWGGTSLYDDYTKTLKAQRAFKVSFDRPFQQNTGAGEVFSWEYSMARWLERNGYDVSYFSDLDIQNNPYALQNHRALLIVGHSEYWSKYMRDNLEAAVNNGINLGVFAANSVYRQVRYEPRHSGQLPLAERVIVCYKDKTLDPYYGKDNSLVATQFRDDPLFRPEQSLLGAMYGSYYDYQNSFPWVVTDASSWVFAGTGLKNGDSLPGLVGYEYDKVYFDYPRAVGLNILSASPIVDIEKKHDVSNATLYTSTNGARVFNAGTIEWSWGLDSANPSGKPSLVSKAAQQITANILHNFLSIPDKFQPQLRPPASSSQTLLPTWGFILLYSFIILIVLYAGYFAFERFVKQ